MKASWPGPACNFLLAARHRTLGDRWQQLKAGWLVVIRQGRDALVSMFLASAASERCRISQDQFKV